MIQDCRYFITVVSTGQVAYVSIVPIASVVGAGLHRLPGRMGAVFKHVQTELVPRRPKCV